MHWNISEMMNNFTSGNKRRILTQGYFGIEREAQRVTATGDLALTPNPFVLGETKNPRITIDFSESQVEMITPPFKSVEGAWNELNTLHAEVENGIRDELLWPFSMPPKLPPEKDIPVARFSDSEKGRKLSIYRNGLALRYGKKMQMISGIHYNFSFNEEMIDYLYEIYGDGKKKRQFTDEIYLAVLRNFLRYRWLFIYLFGASPLCDPTYHSVIEKEIAAVNRCCPQLAGIFKSMPNNITSLRVSRFGYSDTWESGQNIYFNTMEEYSRKLRSLMSTKSEKYAKLGMYENGRQLQINANVLQMESEFYSSIRPKQNVGQGETQLDALEKRGIKYIEVRIMDINPFASPGISLEQMHFMQVFILFCLFERSDDIDEKMFSDLNLNHHAAALLGRNTDLMLYKYGESEISLKDWGNEIFGKLQRIAALMDNEAENAKFMLSVQAEYKKLSDLALLPSERMSREMKAYGMDYLEYGVALAKEHKETLLERGSMENGKRKV